MAMDYNVCNTVAVLFQYHWRFAKAVVHATNKIKNNFRCGC